MVSPLLIEDPDLLLSVREAAQRNGTSEIDAIRLALSEMKARAERRRREIRAFHEEGQGLRERLGEEAFRPVTKAEYDALNDV